MAEEQSVFERVMNVVVQAHQALERFHKDLVPVFEIVDRALGKPEPVAFTPVEEQRLMISGGTSLREPGAWLPQWFGRFYLDKAQEARGGPVSLAFVWIAIRDPRIADLSAPEIWFGVVRGLRPGGDLVAAARHAWTTVDVTSIPRGDWVEATREGANGAGNVVVRRVLMAQAWNADRVGEIVVRPLRAKLAETSNGTA